MPPGPSPDADFHVVYSDLCDTDQKLSELEKNLVAQEAQIAETRAQQDETRAQRAELAARLEALKSQLKWNSELDGYALAMLFGGLSPRPRANAARACKDFKRAVKLANKFGVYPTGLIIAVGADWTMVRSYDGKVYTFGSGQRGQLGHNSLNTEAIPRLVSNLPEVKVVTAGGFHVVACTPDGQVYTWGEGSRGQLGHPGLENMWRYTELTPRRVKALKGLKVVGVTAGAFHTAVLTADGEVSTFGGGRLGQCGHGSEEHTTPASSPVDEPLPRQVLGLQDKHVEGVTAGAFHTAVWTTEGVFTFGNGSCGQLGLGDQSNWNSAPHELPHSTSHRWASSPHKVEVPGEVAAVAAGGDHTVICTTEGHVHTCGKGTDGQLGHGGGENEPVPRLVETLEGRNVVAVVAGDDHTLFLTSQGQVYTCGNGTDGQLGHGTAAPERVPRPMKALNGINVKVVATGCRAKHSFVVTNTGEIYSWGKNASGQLGHEGKTNVSSPTQLTEYLFD